MMMTAPVVEDENLKRGRRKEKREEGSKEKIIRIGKGVG